MARIRIANRLVISLLLIHAALLAWGATRHSFAWTEAGLLPAGILHWRTGSFEHFRVNPPVLRMFATLPVLAMAPDLTAPPSERDPRVRSEWGLASSFVGANGKRSLWMITVARWTCIPISLLGAWICYRWATELFGQRAGLLAVALWCFSPEIIAHGQMISGDAAAAGFGSFAMYLVRDWIRAPQWRQSIAAGIVIGVAICVKTTWLILFGLVPVLWLVCRITGITRTANKKWVVEVLMIIGSMAIALLLINASYGFSGSFQWLGDFEFLSQTLTGMEPLNESDTFIGHNRFRGTPLGALPVPLPKDFLVGLDLQMWDFQRPRISYLDRQWSHMGWWNYYLYALAFKMPIGTWLLVALAGAAVLTRTCERSRLADELLLIVPSLAIAFLASSQTGLSKHSRYVLPMLPFLYVALSRVVTIDVPRLLRHLLVGAPLTWSIASSLWIYPHSLSYFNESVGGPINGYRYLNSSNIHWGEDLLYFKDWHDSHPDAQPLFVSYTLSPVGTDYIWTESTTTSTTSNSQTFESYAHGSSVPQAWISLDVAVLTADPRPLEILDELPMVGMAGYGFRIYRVPASDVERIERELSVPLRPFKHR